MYRSNSFSQLPEVVKNLLIINILFFLAKEGLDSYGIDLGKWFGLHQFQSPDFMPYQLVTHFFMHGDFWHLFFNMFAVWMFGKILENVWGGKRFLIYYMITALGAAGIYLLYIAYDLSTINDAIVNLQNNPSPELFAEFVRNNIPLKNLNYEYRQAVVETINGWGQFPGDMQFAKNAIQLSEEFLHFKRDIPMVGASGAVFGILLAFGMLFPNTLLYIYFAIPIKAKYFVIIYGSIELYLGLSHNPTDNVAHFAHLGGMLFGFILLKYWQKNNTQFY